MSNWTSVKGILEIDTPGRTQAECQYVVDTVISHLPKVTGSEHDMDIYVIKCAGTNVSSDYDEFGKYTEDGVSYQSRYMIAVDGDLRDRYFEETKEAFMNWLDIFTQRLFTTKCIVKITGYSKESKKRKEEIISPDEDYLTSKLITNDEEKATVAWCNYLMWQYPHDEKGEYLRGKPDYADGSFLDSNPEREEEN